MGESSVSWLIFIYSILGPDESFPHHLESHVKTFSLKDYYKTLIALFKHFNTAHCIEFDLTGDGEGEPSFNFPRQNSAQVHRGEGGVFGYF